MLLNLDIWDEIVHHLDHILDRRTLSALARTSHGISSLALDALWWGGGSNSSRAIVSIINSFSPSPGKPFLQQMESYEGTADANDDVEDTAAAPGRRISSWVLNGPIPPAVCERALAYVARVKSLYVPHNGSLDGLLWPILSASLNVRGPLFPNIRTLGISFQVSDRNEYLIPLLSPSLKVLEIRCGHSPELNAITTFLNLAKVRGCNLEVFTYTGAPGSDIFGAIMLFNNLEKVQVITDEPFTQPRRLARLCSSSKGESLSHANLREITFGTDPAILLQDLFRVCVFPSVTNVTLRTLEVLNLEVVQLSCPNMRKLDLKFRTPGAPLEFRHLVPLLSLSIQSFTISVPEHTLTTSNLYSLVEAWPNISLLKITSDTLFDPLPSLAIFSVCQCLNTLYAPLSLAGLLEDISKEREGAIPHGGNTSPLRALHLTHWGPGPLSTMEKRVVVERLLRLFPRLAELKFVAGCLYIEDGLEEFREIFAELGKGVDLLLGF